MKKSVELFPSRLTPMEGKIFALVMGMHPPLSVVLEPLTSRPTADVAPGLPER
jgi:hypothetical protein